MALESGPGRCPQDEPAQMQRRPAVGKTADDARHQLGKGQERDGRPARPRPSIRCSGVPARFVREVSAAWGGIGRDRRARSPLAVRAAHHRPPVTPRSPAEWNWSTQLEKPVMANCHPSRELSAAPVLTGSARRHLAPEPVADPRQYSWLGCRAAGAAGRTPRRGRPREKYPPWPGRPLDPGRAIDDPEAALLPAAETTP